VDEDEDEEYSDDDGDEVDGFVLHDGPPRVGSARLAAAQQLAVRADKKRTCTKVRTKVKSIIIL
jgi:hypothetical protein